MFVEPSFFSVARSNVRGRDILTLCKKYELESSLPSLWLRLLLLIETSTFFTLIFNISSLRIYLIFSVLDPNFARLWKVRGHTSWSMQRHGSRANFQENEFICPSVNSFIKRYLSKSYLIRMDINHRSVFQLDILFWSTRKAEYLCIKILWSCK